MTNKTITLNAKGFPEILIGAGRGTINVGRGHYIGIKLADRIKYFYIKGVARTNDIMKEISMNWCETEIATTDLAPLYTYFDVNGECIKIEKVLRSFESESKGKIEVAPNVFMYSYDAFYDIMGTDKAGIVLYAIAMDRFFKETYGVNILKITSTGYFFIQPVTFTVNYTERSTNESNYDIAVNVIDGVAPFTYSKDNITWASSNTLSYGESEVKTIYVKDSEGTKASLTLNNSSWNIIA